MKSKILIGLARKMLPVLLGAAGAFAAGEYTNWFNTFCQGVGL
ncbi:hypothetical protein [Pseudophaeobacter arcticus]|nr:hypothetical protein [Pseudophaeobacter arcticus]